MLQVLRPRDFGDLFQQTFELSISAFPRLFLVQVVFWVPASAFLAVDPLAVEYLQRGRETPNELAVFGMVAVSGLFILAVMLLSIIVNGASLLVVSDHFTGRKTSIGTAYAVAFRRFGGLVGVAFLVGLMGMLWILPGVALFLVAWIAKAPVAVHLLGLCLALLGIIPMFYFIYGVFLVAAQVYITEGGGVVDALARARYLSKGFRARTIFLVLLVSLIVGMAAGVVSAPAHFVKESFRDDLLIQFGAQYIAQLIHSLAGGVIGAVLAVCVYYDFCVRKDGLDVRHLVELVDQIEARSRGGARLSRPGVEPHPAAESYRPPEEY